MNMTAAQSLLPEWGELAHDGASSVDPGRA
jgi:hypothetical protein